MYCSVHAFHNLAKQLLTRDGVDYILSTKLNRDPLKKHFRDQRARRGSNENPHLKKCTDNEKNCWLQVHK